MTAKMDGRRRRRGEDEWTAKMYEQRDRRRGRPQRWRRFLRFFVRFRRRPQFLVRKTSK